MEGRSASNCRRNGVIPAISVKGTTPDKTKSLHMDPSPCCAEVLYYDQNLELHNRRFLLFFGCEKRTWYCKLSLSVCVVAKMVAMYLAFFDSIFELTLWSQADSLGRPQCQL